MAVSERNAPNALTPGLVAGEWILANELATGGYGEVWIAHHVRTPQRAAVKILHGELVSSEESVGRLLREAEVIGALEHRAIVGLYQGGRLDDGRPFIAMELIEGENLKERIARRGRLSTKDAIAIVAELAEGLEVAHAAGVVHRDIKASNVMLSPIYGGERVVLLDFGIAKLTASDAPSLTASQFTVGTPACMAPEQLLGQPVTPATDVYALGALAYFILTGQMPFADSPPLLLPYLHQHGKRPVASELADVPHAVDAAIAKAMAPKVEERYSSAAEFARALATALTDSVIATPTASIDTALGLRLVVGFEAGGNQSEAAHEAFETALERGEDVLEKVGARLIAESEDSLTFVLKSDADIDRSRLEAIAEQVCAGGTAITVALFVSAGREADLGQRAHWPHGQAGGLIVLPGAEQILS